MAVLKLSTPGVYVQEISSFPPSVAEVETAIAGFAGYTEKATSNGLTVTLIPTRVTNLGEYVLFFGGAPQETEDSVTIDVVDLGSNSYTITVKQDAVKKFKHNMYYAVKSFFDNGGSTCYIASVGAYTAAPGTIASAEIKKGLEALKEIDEVTLLVVPEAQYADTYKNVVQDMITQAALLKDRFALIDPDMITAKTSLLPSGNIPADVANIRNATVGVDSDRYAAAYYPNLISSYEHKFDFDNLTIDTGTAALVGKKMSELGVGSVLYAKMKEAMSKITVELPPAATMAGVYTRVDSTKGVWKAPANESVLSIVGPSIPISSREQEDLNVDPNSGKSINVIRSFPGYGTLVWGARTLNGNDNEWRYISVRRFFNMVEESIKKSIQWAVFEPNTINTWVKVQAMIENYLFLKWREGALAGVKPEQAFYVKVGLGATMTSLDVLEGRMNVEIGMAVARPAEFIILKFIQLLQQS
jgi:uncharacterized protein